MRLLTWNIQCGKGCDGATDLARIVAVAKQTVDADVLCFQEVSSNFSELDGNADQSAQLATLLPGYTPIFRPAIETVDRAGRPHRFGNMTLSRLPVMQIANHLLPWPGAGTVRSMRRHALEVTVQAAFGAVRIVNTHLEYHSAGQREAQIGRLLDLQEKSSTSPKVATAEHEEPYGSQTVAASSVMCGDFNFDVSDPQHALIDRSGRRGLNYRDAWTIGRPDRPREPTCGLYDHAQWTEGPDCRDFIFVTEDLADRVRCVGVNGTTDASDHQPVFIDLADSVQPLPAGRTTAAK
ncbi:MULTISPECIES: endonuclease/exonuclease/phosphatase family protein [unclassified Bradyrhizobium]|uniref:endonuclease/exonuclease/phosphatase family protein n=1 Tax=unclassified Bradyrhizobium TaxID=2631580 RepID=UPI0024791692|nr:MULTISPECIES: endonuclease/exonuclease/phosphatase family protein [unclassified Bradyrhizobium]WGR70164.1 endonuclease/exonuclease/phosphatase family protein [Bradyrhizobium sp. ISRA426]WGR82221.1 endonuclease/exonuclease/phosphatase family protein [Bradyrhizobium sp. ISRA430]WGR85407.1 endonuclease/exonuclease/phosphatase family protein [Bradyrhizobium sp. ISRA432]